MKHYTPTDHLLIQKEEGLLIKGHNSGNIVQNSFNICSDKPHIIFYQLIKFKEYSSQKL